MSSKWITRIVSMLMGIATARLFIHGYPMAASCVLVLSVFWVCFSPEVSQ